MLPRGCSYITAALNTFRRALEAAVTELRGEVGLCDAALIQTCYRYERHAQLAQRWLRMEGESMNVTERLACSAAIAKASAERDRCLEKLGIDKRCNADPWDAIDGRVATDDTEVEPTTDAQNGD